MLFRSPSAVILEPPKIKSDTVSTVSPSISHEVMGPDAMILIFRIYLTMPETWVQSLGWVDPLEKEISTYSNMFFWEIYEKFYMVSLTSFLHPVPSLHGK